jgi:hypothetical protein
MSRVVLKSILIATVFLCGTLVVRAQSSRPAPSPPPSVSSQHDRPDNRPDFGADPGEDLRVRLAIKTEQRQYDENLARAREASELGSQLLEGYEANKIVDADEEKKLDRLEKLVKKIRNDAGGQNNEDEPHDQPGTLETAIKRVADLATELRKDVEKTPRHVVSAAVINRANDLLGLIQRLRKLTR